MYSCPSSVCLQSKQTHPSYVECLEVAAGVQVAIYYNCQVIIIIFTESNLPDCKTAAIKCIWVSGGIFLSFPSLQTVKCAKFCLNF